MSVYLFDELHRTDAWRWLDRGFEKNRKRAGIVKLHTDYFIIKGDPYWQVAIAVVNRQYFEGGPTEFPTITFA